MGNTYSHAIEEINQIGKDVTKEINKCWLSDDECELTLMKPEKPNLEKSFFGDDWTKELSHKEKMLVISLFHDFFNQGLQEKETLKILEVNSGQTPISQIAKGTYLNKDKITIIASDLYGSDKIIKESADESVKNNEDIYAVISFKPPPNLKNGPDLASVSELNKKPGTKFFICYGEMGGGEGSTNFWDFMKLWKWKLIKCITIHSFIDMFTSKKCWKCFYIFKKD